MKSFHRLFVILLALLSIIAVPGCGKKSTSKASAGKIKIGFLVKQPEEMWFRNEWKFPRSARTRTGRAEDDWNS